MTTVVEAIDLKKTYILGKVPVEALRGINLKVEKGDFVAILGPSGSGKSTLLNMIGALDKPTAGKMLIEGIDISTLNDNQLADLRRNVGFVFQFFNMIPRLSARENVELAMSIAGVGRNERRKRAEQLLETVGLKDRTGHRPSELSGGEQQMVAIGRALMAGPKVLILDEPTEGLDSDTERDVFKALTDFARGKTVVMVTHDPHAAARAKRTLYLNDGAFGQTFMQQTNIYGHTYGTAFRSPDFSQIAKACGAEGIRVTDPKDVEEALRQGISKLWAGEDPQKILDKVAAGEVDIIIGTHRLLSPDVGFKDLGLVVVDELHAYRGVFGSHVALVLRRLRPGMRLGGRIALDEAPALAALSRLRTRMAAGQGGLAALRRVLTRAAPRCDEARTCGEYLERNRARPGTAAQSGNLISHDPATRCDGCRRPAPALPATPRRAGWSRRPRPGRAR